MMRTSLVILSLILSTNLVMSQQKMTPETLWSLKRLSVMGVDEAQKNIYYKLKIPNVEENNFDTEFYKISITGGSATKISEDAVEVVSKNISPNKKYELFDKTVRIEEVTGKNRYKNLPKSNAYVYTDLDIRHWDTWNDGTYSHVFYKAKDAKEEEGIDVMPEEPYYSPQRPFGGDEDYIWVQIANTFIT